MLAILLAAGAGRRLGGPKALLELKGRTTLERCVEALREGGATSLRVVLGAEAERVLRRHQALDVDFVLNADWEHGQTSSLRAGLTAPGALSEPFALHTVDHPLLEAAQLEALREAFAERPDGKRIVVPSHAGRRGHPALFERELADEFLALDASEPAHRVLRADAARVLHLELDAPWLVRDLDTPADLADALAALG